MLNQESKNIIFNQAQFFKKNIYEILVDFALNNLGHLVAF